VIGMATAKILVVDDDADAAMNLSDILADFGYQTDLAYRGWDALHLIEHKQYDLALLDFKLPCMNGVELFQRIRQVRPEIIGVLVTAYAGLSPVANAVETGIRKVLAKPLDVGQLIHLLKETVGDPSRSLPNSIAPA
jgi:CheY-like chemotaxis protein